MKIHQGAVLIDDIMNLIVVVVHFKSKFMKVVQNQLLFRETNDALCEKYDLSWDWDNLMH